MPVIWLNPNINPTSTGNGNNNGYTVRTSAGQNLTNDPALATAGSQVRVTFRASSAANASVCQNCSIGVQLLNSPGWTSAIPVELKFGGVSGFNIASGTFITSDLVNLNFAQSDIFVVIVDHPSSATGQQYSSDGHASGPQQCYFNAASSSYNVAQPPTLTISPSYQDLWKIETPDTIVSVPNKTLVWYPIDV